MTAPPEIPREVLDRQREASDPAGSAWVSANAGSGKTYVLAQRVIRLLLQGTPPAKILCITFTKAAAANMAASVFDRLAQWTALEDDALDAAIHAMSREWPSPQRRAAARRLFAQALETPGGLKVQTIHAFCTRLLQQFPFEANVPARFAVLDEAAESQLIDQLTFDCLLEASAQPESRLGRALATIIAVTSDQAFRDVLSEAIRKRVELMGWIDAAGGIDGAIADLSAALGLSVDETADDIAARFLDQALISAAEWPAVRTALAQGSKADIEQSERFGQLTALTGSEQIRAYLQIFCTQKGEPRARLATNGFAARYPGLAQRLSAERERVCALLPRWRAAMTRDRTAALITLAGSVIARFRAEKDRRGLLDYDDLIEKTGTLLRRVDAAWVHYKLDLGVDHVLIDEAQDTSPRQWELIERLTAEFATGEGARGSLARTIFAVGDDKQSIFSFQGALPAAFGQKRRDFQRAYAAAGLRFLGLEFKHSFRSAQTVLDAVDLVFKTPGAFRGLDDPVAPVHLAVRSQAPGLVEIWPLAEPEPSALVEGWDAPFDTTAETSPRVALARRIAKCVKLWIARGVKVGDGAARHAITPGDILILVRQRGPLFEAVIRALKNVGIPVAGADRLVLTEHIAVMDLMALADALLLPDDDLALATVLKSPLFGLSEDDLFALCWQRRGSLRAALAVKAKEDLVLAAAEQRLNRLALAARRETPFGFYARVLGPEGGRRHFLARLGPEATDALDEFLNIALDYERRQPASLQGFVAWLRSANAEIKRDMEISRDEVRVMTVHGAKGLEAPVVFLADTTTPPAGPPQRQPRLLRLAGARQAAQKASPLVWLGRKDDDVPPLADARRAAAEAAENEHRRLLYVAMTRAADRLVVCGAVGERGSPPGCWYEMVQGALVGDQAPGVQEEPADDGDGMVWRLRGRRGDVEDPGESPAIVGARPSLRPAWLDQAGPGSPTPTRALLPSDETGLAPRLAAAGAASERIKALARGTLVHRLLQALPTVAPERRREAMQAYLANAGPQFTAEERARIEAQVEAVLEDARFAELFGKASRAEVAIAGLLEVNGEPRMISGQVDRLAVTANGILIADYKTVRSVPTAPEDVPESYVHQLALYRGVLRRIYPKRTVTACLIFTEGPDLVEIPAGLLDRALAALTSP
ncbi:MAG TPA: double-strand break repair helicase AddA [Xanthobacteraceae bacterium]|nr:double-strand break repair helicase AddA [Xanthobacteraceae bacterium]